MPGRSLPTKPISSVAMTTSKAQFDPTGLSGTHGVRPPQGLELIRWLLSVEPGGKWWILPWIVSTFQGLSWILREFSQLLMYWDGLAAYVGGMVKLLGGDTNAANYPSERDLCGSSGFVVFVFSSSQR